MSKREELPCTFRGAGGILNPAQAAAQSNLLLLKDQVITQNLMVALDLSAPGLNLVAQLCWRAGFSSRRNRESFACPGEVATGECSCTWLGPSATPCSSWGLLSGHPLPLNMDLEEMGQQQLPPQLPEHYRLEQPALQRPHSGLDRQANSIETAEPR